MAERAGLFNDAAQDPVDSPHQHSDEVEPALFGDAETDAEATRSHSDPVDFDTATLFAVQATAWADAATEAATEASSALTFDGATSSVGGSPTAAVTGANDPISAGDKAMVSNKPPVSGKRSRGILIATIAVLVLAVAGTATAFWVSAKQTAEAAEAAMAQLAASEYTLTNRINEVNADIAALTAGIAKSAGDAESLAQPLASMAGVSDETVRVTAETARQTLATAVSAIEVPAALSTYHRDDIDTGSLDEIAAAQDEVDVRVRAAAESAAAVADARRALSSADSDFVTAMSTFRAAIPAFAEVLIAENPDAEESFKTSVTQAAAAFATTAVVSEARAAAWNAYIAAVGALRADQHRAEQERDGYTPPQSSRRDSGQSDPQPDPVEPDPVEPDPVEPDPVQPDPVQPDPDPTPSE